MDFICSECVKNVPDWTDIMETSDFLDRAGLRDRAKAERLLNGLAGQSVTDDDLAPLLPVLAKALHASPDPDRALHSFARWFAVIGSPRSYLQILLSHPLALTQFCLVTGSSQYFADLLVRQPECFEIIANPGVRGGTKTASRLIRELSQILDVCQTADLKKDVLRRWKAREMLRIGVRDLLGLAEMPATAREFSNLADACVHAAYQVALMQYPLEASTVPIPFAIIGMGKLGGQELNYSSDIDLIFVHGDDLPAEMILTSGRKMEPLVYLGRVAETLIKVLTEETPNGHVFRVDMRLRPEGRFGALVRSLAGCRAYYESWAENWERQALLKARFVAGDRQLGAAFMAFAQPYVYRRTVSGEFIADIRVNKRRIESHCALEGETESNIKTGYGGIRDIEFTAQLLQLEHGGRLPHLQTPNTLSALQRLRHTRLLPELDTQEMASDYQFLRNLEHRLQLLHGFQTQTLPPYSDAPEWNSLARRMGFATRLAFEAELGRRRERVNRFLDTFFYAATPSNTDAEEGNGYWGEFNNLLDNLDTPIARQRLQELLKGAGFQDMNAAMHALEMPMSGNQFGGMPPDTPQEFKAVATALLELAAHSPDPDAALAGIEALALAVPNRAQLYAAFDDSPELLSRLVTLSAAAPHLMKRLTRYQEWLEMLADDEADEAKIRFDLPSGKSLATHEQAVKSLARFYLRETLRIGAREVWKTAVARHTMHNLTRLAETMLDTILILCREEILKTHSDPEFARTVLERAALVGLGKLGGIELGYASDWDALCVYDLPQKKPFRERAAEANTLALNLIERVVAFCGELSLYGAAIDLDLRLRPWGKKGALIMTPSGYAAYFRNNAEMWERQAMLKARVVAGNAEVGKRLVRVLYAASFGRGLSSEEDAAIHAMKQRIETERLKPSERETDVKLGWGGLSDIEWLAQRLQLREGRGNRALRVAPTLQALSELAHTGILINAEADMLQNAYEFLASIRNTLWLATGTALDAFPLDERRRQSLARQLGYEDAEQSAGERLWHDVHATMQEVRRVFQERFISAG